MWQTNFVFYFSKILAELAKDVIYFPIWWYSQGLWQLIVKLETFLSNTLKSLSLMVWLKYLLVPMYGQRDIAGWLISFFIRLIQIVFRSLWFGLMLLVSLLVIIVWLLGPLLIIYQIIWQLI